MNSTSLLVALVTMLSLAGSPQASEKPAKEPADSPKPTTKGPDSETSSPAVRNVVTDDATPLVKKKPGAPAAKHEFVAVLERCDENRDQAVTLAEFQKNQPAGKDAAAVEKWFQARDSNRDGQLSKEDFKPVGSKKS